jgi:hypothetical protein
MAIEVTKDGGRTRIVGSETYANGMTLGFRKGNGNKYFTGIRHYNRPEILDMHHAREWLAGDRSGATSDRTEAHDGRKVEGVQAV